MSKILISKKQILNVISEQSMGTRKYQLPTIWNMYKRKKVDASYVVNFMLNQGVKPEEFGLHLKNKRFLSVDIANFLKEIGWSDKQIKKLKLPKLKVNKNKTDKRNGYTTKPGRSLGSTGKIGSGCTGSSCSLREEKKPMRKYIFTEEQIKNIVDSVIEESIQLTEQEEEKKRIVAVQKFLNSKYPKLQLVADGITGPKTKMAIEKYQTQLGVYPVDGVWGPITEKKMPQKDKVLFDAYIKESDDIFDKIVKFFTSKKQQ